MNTSSKASHPALFNLGFRAFFAGASVLAVISIGIWLLLYANLNGYLPGIHIVDASQFTRITPFQWHAHEMIYGYSLAVIAGFLLTAVKNWTGIQTLHGYPLAILFSTWVIARVLWLFGENGLFGENTLIAAALFELLFILGMCYAIAAPIIATKQWRQMAILSKIFLLALGNLAFYLDAFGYFDSGIHMALYGGLYLVIGLILTIGRRIIPMFIQNGVSYEVTLFNAKWIDICSLVGVLGFFISEVFFSAPLISSLFAGLMVLVTSIRIVGWYTHGIWQNPLLWCFHVALFFIDLGFLLFILAQWFAVSPFLSVHAFAFGAIGVITMGMMARVSTGHTGRSLKVLPVSLLVALLLLTLGAISRVILPIFIPAFYPSWVIISGILWVLAFGLFCFTFLSYWTSPRVDQKYG